MIIKDGEIHLTKAELEGLKESAKSGNSTVSGVLNGMKVIIIEPPKPYSYYCFQQCVNEERDDINRKLKKIKR